MAANRPLRHESRESIEQTSPPLSLLQAETLRNAAAPPPQPTPARGEEQIPIFWRIFGGTLISIAALVAITLYNQFNNGLNELRAEIVRLKEQNGDLVKKAELREQAASLSTGLKDVQAAQAGVTALRERSLLLEQQLKTAEDERRELAREVQRMRERLAAVEGQQAGPRSKANPTATEMPTAARD